MILGTDCTNLNLPFNFDCKMGAITLDQTIVFRGAYDAMNNWGSWAHELVHVSQYDSLGVDGFAFIYASPGAYSLEKQAYDWSATVQAAIPRKMAAGPYWTMIGQRVPLGYSEFQRAASNLLSDAQWVSAHSRWGNGADCSQLLGPGTDTGVNLNDSQAHPTNGEAYERSGDVPHAIIEYTAAVQSNRTNASALNRLGNMLSRVGRSAEGSTNLKKAVCVSGGSQSSYRSDLASAMKQSGDARAALLEYQASVYQYPYSYVDHLGLAAAFRVLGDTYDADVHEWAGAQLSPPAGGPAYEPLRNALLSHWSQDTVVTDSYGTRITHRTLLRLDQCVLAWTQETDSTSATGDHDVHILSSSVDLNHVSRQGITANVGSLLFSDPTKTALRTLMASQTPNGWRPPPSHFTPNIVGLDGLENRDEATRILALAQSLTTACGGR